MRVALTFRMFRKQKYGCGNKRIVFKPLEGVRILPIFMRWLKPLDRILYLYDTIGHHNFKWTFIFCRHNSSHNNLDFLH